MDSPPEPGNECPYTIHHANGTSLEVSNQQTGMADYNLLGTYTFNQGTTHKVELTDQADGYVIADAIQLIPVNGATANTATWQPALTQTTEYEVFAKWTGHPNRATNATYTVNHTGGSLTVMVNQQTGAGTFNSLGVYTLDTNSTITLTDEADGYVIADAVKFVRTGTPPPTTTGGLFFYHTDHLGTPQSIADDTQSTVWEATYTPFGEATVTTETITNNMRFPGQYYDDETGLHYNYFRYYDPTIGRYITSDPIGLEGGMNTYAYALMNPIGLTDFYGLNTVLPWVEPIIRPLPMSPVDPILPIPDFGEPGNPNPDPFSDYCRSLAKKRELCI